jgi:hypothetical protein
MITMLSAMNAMSSWKNTQFAVGDIIAFRASSQRPVGGMPSLTVETAEGHRCTIDLATVQSGGGSFLVEARPTKVGGLLQLHWVGPRTAPDERDCGSDRSLVIDRRQLDTLLLAAAVGRIGAQDDPAHAGSGLYLPANDQQPPV